MKPEFKVGEEVIDDLTGQKTKIVSIVDDGSGYMVDSSYLNGARHAWELTKLNETEIVFIMYSSQYDSIFDSIKTLIHGIFTEKEVAKYKEQRRKGCNGYKIDCMIVPLNKFVETGVEL
jgi:esterase/lipase superfamily enzyme